MTHFKKTGISVVLIIEAIVFCLTISWQFRGNVLNSAHIHKTNTATVFIPGYGGNLVSTQDFIDQYSEHNIATKTLRVHISKDGKVSTAKHYKAIGNNNPLIQLTFEDNTHTKKQGKQMINVMHYLYQTYHIKSVNFLGHSSGGNIAFHYMTHHPKAKNVPKVNKFVTIAANYDPNNKYVKQIPRNIKILNIAGEIYHFKSDGEVPVNIVQPMGKLVSKYVNHYRFYLYRSNPLNAEHSMLHENPSLDKIIAEFLFN